VFQHRMNAKINYNLASQKYRCRFWRSVALEIVWPVDSNGYLDHWTMIW